MVSITVWTRSSRFNGRGDITQSLQRLSLALVIGLLTGALTLLGQRYLPGPLLSFANCYSVWLSAAFLFGTLVRSPLWAFAGGAIVQLSALAGYYLTSFLVLNLSLDSYGYAVFWGIGGVIGGPAFGLAGYWWGNGAGIRRIAGGALLGASYLSEGAYFLDTLGYDIGYAFLIIGLASAFLLQRSPDDAVKSLGISLVAAMFLFLVYTYGFNALNDAVAGIGL